uniref:Peroxisomal membrane protein MPV17 n=1 Tax=Compsopogon caeruleus TaxID=31354 RepID=A0A7S1XB96_9RHOD|mmetsp:Transcript_11501/g.23384  ORF Transcript_11501/g.23384 Transcript_11501/m.23384 type:complete len:191 (+) Transcript_11501:131-703(+)|eukprot:CAMPEP_0184682114 /NCGR_PEP_ID=MMETSP0312-20130426/5856_1 /TAXON_ID=31354 /ORGANISM="Compsopogon coeruleus, Strain SAG 36.94" /LENGTH=190 /DNA_ID=CAMNT_0027133501 /DNA_START=82 /DNA_END=654 /DNA_ORIENTATION=+
MAGIWAKYNQVLAEKPLMTKTMTSFTGFVLGDLVAQSPDLQKGKAWDSWRTAKLALFGLALHGPIGHYWYGFLDRTVMTAAPTSAAAVASKTAIDQILWAPIFTSIFFGSMKLLDGKQDEIPDEIREKLWPTMKVNWTVWPLAHVINFRFIPSSQRILYINVIQVGYNAFLSTMQASKKEEPKGLASALE